MSDCEKYRYELSRVWDESSPLMLFIMLNPSTANHLIDDPTIRKCIGFASRHGYGGILVGNLFALRATNPKELKKAVDPFGPDNIKHLKALINMAGMIVFGYGNAPIKPRHEVFDVFTGHDVYCLGTNKNGSPKHPLYVSYSSGFEKFQL